jgi:hypothetical protein
MCTKILPQSYQRRAFRDIRLHTGKIDVRMLATKHIATRLG